MPDHKMVWVLNHPPTEQDRPVYHSSAQCPAVTAWPDEYSPVPVWIVKQAAIRCCVRTGPCRVVNVA